MSSNPHQPTTPARGMPEGSDRVAESAKIAKAIAYATQKHEGQVRRGAKREPYIQHPIRVMELLVWAGEDDLLTLKAAVNHDVLEETCTTREERAKARVEMAYEIGEVATRIVVELTDPLEFAMLSLADRKSAQAERARRLLRSARVIKLADQIDNLRSLLATPPGWRPERILTYADGAASIAAIVATTNSKLDQAFRTAYFAVIRRYAPDRAPRMPSAPG